MHRPGHKQRYSNRPSISDLPKREEREESRKKDIESLTLRGRESSMQEFLGELDAIDYLEGKWRHMDKYRRENLWKQWQQSGRPTIRTWSKEEFTKAGNVFTDPEEKAWWHGEPRAFYEPLSNRMTIPLGTVEKFFAELSHASQWGAKDKSKRISLWDKFKAPYQRMIYGEKVYDMPGHLEHGAHSEIQPEMEKEYLSSSPLYGVEESKPVPLSIRHNYFPIP